MFSHFWANLRGTSLSLTAQVWVYSSRALTKPLGLPDLLVGHACGCSYEVAVEHLGLFVHLNHFVKCLE